MKEREERGGQRLGRVELTGDDERKGGREGGGGEGENRLGEGEGEA